MKSAYERAMEKMQAASGPLRELSEAQREALQELDRKLDAQAAQVALDFDQKIATASRETIQQLRAERAEILQSIEEKRERENNRIWEER